MVGSSKILTVSYGTYSVTAEGFDDPLGVVKETTQFIRGVVTEDPLFGAEPPQIGSEMVEEYIQTRFAAPPEARLSLNAPGTSSGALAAALAAGPARQSPGLAPALPDDDTIEATARIRDGGAETALAAGPADSGADAHAAPEPDPDSDPESGTVRPAADTGVDTTPGTATEMAGETAEPAPAPRKADPDSVAAKLARIRSVVAGQTAPAGAAPVTLSDAGDGALTDALAGMMSDHAPERDAPAGASSESVTDDLWGPDEDAYEDEDTDDVLRNLLADVDDAEEEAGDEFVATEERGANPDADAFPWDEDEDDEDDAPVTARDRHEDDLGDDDLWDDDDDERPEQVAAAGRDEDWDALAEAWQEDDDAPAAAAPAPAPPQAPTRPPATGPIRARVVKIKRALFDQAIASGKLEAIDEDDEDDAPAKAPRGEIRSSLSPEEEEELARELAAVKAELGDWADDEDAYEDGVPDAPAGTASRVVPNGVSDNDDFEDDDEFEDDDFDRAPATAARVADVDEDEDDDRYDAPEPAPLRLEHPVQRSDRDAGADLPVGHEASREDAEHDWDDDADDALEGARKAVKMSSPARALLTEQKVEDYDASRILDQTNEELDEPEGNRRRSAIAHLRAAVAATRADRLLGRKPDTQQQSEPYREDLATVVRPRRPQAPSGRSDRPADSRPAPLKLVAEQRIPDAAPAEPVRPRRIRTADLDPQPTRQEAAAQGGEAGFAAYAERVGARDLPELLEAAAAYMAFVEGRDQFSRPQLMTTMRQAERVESSREDRLRSFGQLLRDGKIEKTSGGRFTASERISFKPRKAG